MIVRLMGGLGNQFFQYAFARKICIENGEKLYLDTLSYRRDKKRNFELQEYHIVINKGKKITILLCNMLLLIGKVFKTDFILKKIFHVEYEQKILRQQQIDNPKGYFIGYWQNKNYFSSIKDILIDELQFSGEVNETQKKILDKIQNENSVAMHIRRGDYLSAECADYRVIKKDYYYRALSYLKEYIDEAVIYVFSDDINWCKREFNDIENVFFVDEKISDSQHIDFMLMRNCKYFIIANSTFSWWASWLATYENKIVIAPEKWFYDEMACEELKNALLGEAILMENDT